MSNREEIKKDIKLPVKYDGMTYVFDAEGKMVCQIRGYGYLSNKYPEHADDKQDAIGEMVAEAINKYLSSPT